MQQQVYKALIDEDNCIGCGKCRQVCPTDAIIGCRHALYTVIPQWCTVCEDCLVACPTNCITFTTLGLVIEPKVEAILVKNKQLRLAAIQTKKAHSHNTQQSTSSLESEQQPSNDRKQQIADAIARVKMRKNRLKEN